MKRLGAAIVCGGWTAFTASFFLLAIQVRNEWDLGWKALFLGWVAVCMAFSGLFWFLPHAVSCLGNLVMLFSPIAFCASPSDWTRRSTPYALLGIVPFSAVAALFPFGLEVTGYGWGFWLWQASFPLVAVGFLLRRPPQAPPSVRNLLDVSQPTPSDAVTRTPSTWNLSRPTSEMGRNPLPQALQHRRVEAANARFAGPARRCRFLEFRAPRDENASSRHSQVNQRGEA